MFKIESVEELEVIREKVTRRAIDFNERELICMTEVYKDIGKHYGQKYILNKSCGSCIKEAMNICYNYVTFHEEKINQDLTLKELRELYPAIKSTSKQGFIKQIK